MKNQQSTADRDRATDTVSHVIFDFDGTLSWLRHGWPGIMREGFLDHAPAEWRNDEKIRGELLSDILSLNGKPTIHQMRSFSERLRTATGRVISPDLLLGEYERRLKDAIAARTSAIEDGTSPDEFVVFGARSVLESLRARGITLIILSGTVETEVRAEAALLGLAPYFDRHIYGSIAGQAFSKKDVIDKILSEEAIEGRHLVSFGDGPVEIQFTKAVGGRAIGVASDEDHNGSHRCDPFKVEQLSRAGADKIIPDYAGTESVLREIFR